MEIRYGNGGWCLVEGDLGLPGRLYVRVSDVDGHLRVTELYIDGRGSPINAAALRKLPLSYLEQWIGHSNPARARLSVAGPDLSRLASYFATTFGKAQHWVADSWRAQYDNSDVRQAPMGDGKRTRGRSEEPESGELLLSAPEDGRLSDAFLSDVVRAYNEAVARRLPPAITLGNLADVSPRTVHRWVYTARKRGVMPPATRKGRIV